MKTNTVLVSWSYLSDEYLLEINTFLGGAKAIEKYGKGV